MRTRLVKEFTLGFNIFIFRWFQFELETGVDGKNAAVRYASDASKFPDYSLNGYVVFSPIQVLVLYQHIAVKFKPQ